MSELDLQTLWQEQPLESPLIHPEATRPLAMVDFAVPTSRFGRKPARGGAVLASVVSLAAVAVFGAFWTNHNAHEPVVAIAPVHPRVDPAEQIEALLAECRSYSNPESGAVDWGRARTACQEVLELEPIHQEANALLGRISMLEVCEQNFNGAKERLSSGRVESALELLEKVGKGCESYLLRSISISRDAVNEASKRAGADCQAYASSAKWELALKRCELYSRLACQHMDPSELYVPALMKLKLHGPLDARTEWRPKDPVYLSFLQAREKLEPGAATWRCPEFPALRSPPAAPDPSLLAKQELAKRYPEPEFGRALVFYFSGDLQSAPVPLQKLAESMRKAQHHQAARALLLDLNEAINLYENGNSQITNGRPEKAEAPFLRALAVDERIVLGERLATLTPDQKRLELEKRVSFIRRAITETMSHESYEKGKMLADRKDFRAACRIWKLGHEFSRSNIDLLKALTNVCTKRAGEAIDQAQSCVQLRAALDFAVEGDGYRQKIEASLEEEGCP